MRIAMVAPPWLPVPPERYGGTESVIDVLVRALVDLGHEVGLYAKEGSTGPVEVRVPRDIPWSSGTLVVESSWVLDVHADIAADPRGFDVVHDHTIGGAMRGIACLGTPVVTTAHWPFTGELGSFSRRVAEASPMIAISETQAMHAPDVPIATVIHHGIDVPSIPVGDGGDYFVFLGRMIPEKGADIAARVAREQGFELKMAARLVEPREIEFFESQVEPLLGGGVEFVGEVGGASKFELLGGACGLLNPIRWQEPFGMVMIESLACGTPVVAFANGAATEIIESGRTGWLCDDDDRSSLAMACKSIGDIDRARCREAVEEHFSGARMASDHVAFYEKVIADLR
jgi:glycosyltransferase involved in cell wall biosynthesis